MHETYTYCTKQGEHIDSVSMKHKEVGTTLNNPLCMKTSRLLNFMGGNIFSNSNHSNDKIMNKIMPLHSEAHLHMFNNSSHDSYRQYLLSTNQYEEYKSSKLIFSFNNDFIMNINNIKIPRNHIYHTFIQNINKSHGTLYLKIKQE